MLLIVRFYVNSVQYVVESLFLKKTIKNERCFCYSYRHLMLSHWKKIMRLWIFISWRVTDLFISNKGRLEWEKNMSFWFGLSYLEIYRETPKGVFSGARKKLRWKLKQDLQLTPRIIFFSSIVSKIILYFYICNKILVDNKDSILFHHII